MNEIIKDEVFEWVWENFDTYLLCNENDETCDEDDKPMAYYYEIYDDLKRYVDDVCSSYSFMVKGLQLCEKHNINVSHFDRNKKNAIVKAKKKNQDITELEPLESPSTTYQLLIQHIRKIYEFDFLYEACYYDAVEKFTKIELKEQDGVFLKQTESMLELELYLEIGMLQLDEIIPLTKKMSRDEQKKLKPLDIFKPSFLNNRAFVLTRKKIENPFMSIQQSGIKIPKRINAIFNRVSNIFNKIKR
jgi:hypothetical protein